MASFTEVFANTVGIKLPASPTDFPTNFVPVPEKFIVINSSGDYESFKYDHFSSVTSMILNKIPGISIVQIGDKKDPLIKNCIDMRGFEIRQSAFIVENSLLLISGDSIYLHIAGQKNIPFIGLFAVTPVQSSMPFYKGYYSILESHRNGNKPTYSADELPKTINLINPEDIANEIGKVLDFTVDIKTFRLGKLFGKTQIDYIPDCKPPMIPEGVPSACRMDVFYNPSMLDNYLTLYSGNIITTHPLPENVLIKHKGKIATIVYFLDFNPSVEFVKFVTNLGIKLQLVTTKQGEKFKEIKYNFYEYGRILQKTPQDKSEISKEYYFDTNRIYIGRGKIYPTLFHYRKDITLNSLPQLGDSLDSKDIDECLDNLIIYEKYGEKKEK